MIPGDHAAMAPVSAGERMGRARDILVNADHFGFVNKYLPWRYPLGGLAMAGVASALCGWFVNVQAFTLLAAVVSVMIIGLAWPWLSTRGLRGRLSFEQARGCEGREVTARLVVTNRLPVGAWGVRLFGGSRGWAGSESFVNLSVIPGWRTTEYILSFVPPMRGEYPAGRAFLSSGFPFGLWEATVDLETSGGLVIWPSRIDLGALPEAAGSDRTREGFVLQDRAGSGGDILGVRPYRRGDTIRRIHWPQTARRGELMICERQASASVCVQLIVDVDASNHTSHRPDSSLEWSIRIAASIASTFLERGAMVELVAGTAWVPLGGGPAQLRRILDRLARLPVDGRERLDEALASPPAAGFRSGLQLAVSTDRAASTLACFAPRRKALRSIVLRSAGFEDAPARAGSEAPEASHAWIVIAGRRGVVEALRRGWREVLHAN